MKSIHFIVPFLLMSFFLFGQNNLVETAKIDKLTLNDRKLDKFLIKNTLFQKQKFVEIEDCCSTDLKEVEVSVHNKSYVIERPLNEVWDTYVHGNLKKMWTGKVLHFGCSFIPSLDSMIYNDNIVHNGISEGQVIVTKLKYLNGLLKIVVAHRIKTIDELNHQLEFCYMKGGKTEGSQILEFSEEAGKTIITHTTIYKGKSSFRDKRLYPRFHTIAIDELHKNIENLN